VTKRSTLTPNPSRFTKVAEFDMLDATQDFQIVSKQGWFHFIALVTNQNGVWWVDGADSRGTIRSIPLDKIKRDRNGNIITRLHP
jgi:hypothetical protein